MAYQLNGSNQWMRVTLSQNVPATLACWARPSVSPARNMNLIVSRVSASASFGIAFEASGVFAAYSGSSSYSFARISGVNAATWHHCAGVFASASSRVAYLDSVASAEQTTQQVTSGLATVDIGNFNGVDLLNGRIAEVGIWNVALTAAEIASLADGMTCDKVRPQSLVFYAPLVRDLQDVRGGLTITNNNTATVANHPRVYA